MSGVWPIYFGPVGVNLSIILLGLLMLVLAMIEKLRTKRTRLFEISILLFLVGFLYLTLHGRLLQFIFPISLPERPLIDNNLTFNYALTSLLTFIIFPILLSTLLRSNPTWNKFGLKVLNFKRTAIYDLFGLIFIVLVFLISQTFFGFRWISGYTLDGLVLWMLLVTFFSVFAQTFFFIGMLFNSYLENENVLLLALISILASQLFTFAPLPWIIANIVGSTAKIVVTWKTRNIYGAALMGIITNLFDILIQIL